MDRHDNANSCFSNLYESSCFSNLYESSYKILTSQLYSNFRTFIPKFDNSGSSISVQCTKCALYTNFNSLWRQLVLCLILPLQNLSPIALKHIAHFVHFTSSVKPNETTFCIVLSFCHTSQYLF